MFRVVKSLKWEGKDGEVFIIIEGFGVLMCVVVVYVVSVDFFSRGLLRNKKV